MERFRYIQSVVAGYRGGGDHMQESRVEKVEQRWPEAIDWG